MQRWWRSCCWSSCSPAYLLAITGTLTKIASTTRLIQIGVHAIDDQVRPIEGEVRGINGALGKVADALTAATR